MQTERERQREIVRQIDRQVTAPGAACQSGGCRPQKACPVETAPGALRSGALDWRQTGGADLPSVEGTVGSKKTPTCTWMEGPSARKAVRATRTEAAARGGGAKAKAALKQRAAAKPKATVQYKDMFDNNSLNKVNTVKN